MGSTILSSICSMVTELVASVRNSPSSSSAPTGIGEDLGKLNRTLRRIQAVLVDAGERELHDQHVKLWLKELKHVAYDAEDLLEEYNQYELLRARRRQEGRAVSSRKRKRDEDNSLLQLSERMRNIRERFDEISKDRKALRLREGDGTRRPDPSAYSQQQTSSHVDESGVFGRDEDRDKLIDMLLSDEGCRFCVIPVVGMGGLGKTTLAQLVYSDPRIRRYFNSLQGWVCVSENFDVARVTREIVESISGQDCSLTQLDALQDVLKEKVRGKRFLLVLDDVWNEYRAPWDSLRAPLVDAGIVRIIATTRNNSVAELMQTVPDPYRLGCLSHDHCWSLFQLHAFGGRCSEYYSNLVEIGHQIISKCGELPLSVKALGCLLRHELDEDGWMEVLESDLWDLDQARKDILPALMLSYHRLPPHLKPCFTYSCLFPKDHSFRREQLIKLWMAQGFILPTGNKRLEDIGSQYFDELQRRSLFQPTAYSSLFVLHDAIHDLARYISDNEFCSVIIKPCMAGYNISKEVRHLYVMCEGKATFEQLSLSDTRSLRTLIIDRQLTTAKPVNLDHLPCLRAAEISRSYSLTSARNHEHMRHLDVKGYYDGGGVLELLCRNYNSQNLEMELADIRNPNAGGNLSWSCQSLLSDSRKYGEDHENCIRLCRLSIQRYSNLTTLPNLPPSLQSLSVFSCFNLKYFTCLPNLVSLQELHIAHCPALQISPSCLLPRSLQNLRIRNCKKISCLAGLRSLVSLKELHLQCCPQLKLLQGEALPPNLQILHVSDCWKLSSLDGMKGLTCLKGLVLERCPTLQILPDDCLLRRPRRVQIFDCPGLREWCERQQFDCNQDIQAMEKVTIGCTSSITRGIGLHSLSSLAELRLYCFGESSLPSGAWLPSTLRKLEICSSDLLQSLHLHPNLSSLQELIINDCLQLGSVVGMHNLSSLKRLVITNCPELQLSRNEQLPCSICSMIVADCRSLRSLPLPHQDMSLFTMIYLANCSSLVDGWELRNLPSLQYVIVWNCPELTSNFYQGFKL